MSDTTTLERPVAAEAQNDGKITCHIDGARVHSVQIWINQNYKDEWTIEDYQAKFPGEPIFSELAKKQLEARAAAKAQQEAVAATASLSTGIVSTKKPMGEVFGFGDVPGVKNARGGPVMCSVFEHGGLTQDFVPEVDANYVHDLDNVKSVLYALEKGKTMYAWGYHGTGKTTTFEQVCALTKRAMIRVQHTINTEESHILGQYVVRANAQGAPETIFQPGPLVFAMLEGLIYLADEYDFAMPSVTSVYQPVLEGKSLVIKDAPPELRVIKPHPNFRFLATGNTNGVGDESGLYQGTQLQNAANYSRFAVTIQVDYMDKDVEAVVVAKQSGAKLADAKKLVDFANRVRTAFAGGDIGSTVSPRELINAADIAVSRGSAWRLGVQQALTNRYSKTDKAVAEQIAQRIFGQ